MQILELINQGSNHLRNNNVKSHQLDSEILLSNLLKKQRESLLVDQSKKVSAVPVGVTHHGGYA